MTALNSFSIEVAYVMVTYNPQDAVKSQINSALSGGSHLIIVDNASSNFPDLSDLQAGHLERLYITRLEKNFGLAYAQNKGIEIAREKNNKFVILLDQDSVTPGDFAARMVRSFNELSESGRKDNPGILAPNFFDPGLNTYARFAQLQNRGYAHKTCAGDKYIRVSFAVASGSLIPMDTIRQAGMMRTEFFIDHIDSDFSLRVADAGLNIFVDCEIIMEHTIGSRERRRFLGLDIKPNHHNEIRKYFSFRNGFRLLWENRRKRNGFTKLMFHRMAHDILGIVLFEKSKLLKLIWIFRALKDSFYFKSKDLQRCNERIISA